MKKFGRAWRWRRRLLSAAGPSSAQGSKRPQVAVMDFEYGTIDNWWGQYDSARAWPTRSWTRSSTTAPSG